MIIIRHKLRVFVSGLLGKVSGYLPGGVVLPEVAKSRLKPCVDIAQSELVIRRLNNGLKEQRTKKGNSVVWLGQSLKL